MGKYLLFLRIRLSWYLYSQFDPVKVYIVSHRERTNLSKLDEQLKLCIPAIYTKFSCIFGHLICGFSMLFFTIWGIITLYIKQ